MQYYYDGDELIFEKTGGSSVYYFHGPKIDEIISDSRGYCYHTDGLGSVVNLTNSSGAKVNAYTYKAFGSIRSQSGSVANLWLFTGRQLDTETGLYYYRNRYYDARVGRFTVRDPVIKINSYSYCNNNPTNLIDSFGKNPFGWDTETQAYDKNFDGVTDGAGVDLNGDGRIDYSCWDSNNDGMADSFDINSDDRADFGVFDTNNDGKPDHAYGDYNSDGKSDFNWRDKNGDGQMFNYEITSEGIKVVPQEGEWELPNY